MCKAEARTPSYLSHAGTDVPAEIPGTGNHFLPCFAYVPCVTSFRSCNSAPAISQVLNCKTLAIRQLASERNVLQGLGPTRELGTGLSSQERRLRWHEGQASDDLRTPDWCGPHGRKRPSHRHSSPPHPPPVLLPHRESSAALLPERDFTTRSLPQIQHGIGTSDWQSQVTCGVLARGRLAT